MSRSNPTVKNPATRFFKWAGGEEGGGQITWYDKEAEEEKSVALPFSFLVLDELSTISGYSKKDRSGFWSNEVRNMKTQPFTVRTGSGVTDRGIYEDISSDIKAKGGKYAKSVYMAYKDDTGELTIGNIKLMGTALTAWIEFQKKFDVMKCAVLVKDGKKETNGSNTYFTPVFSGQKVSDATNAEAEALDKELQAYLKSYFNYVSDEIHNSDDDSDDVPEPKRAEKEIEIEDLGGNDETPPKAKAKATEPVGDDSIPLEDVPF